VTKRRISDNNVHERRSLKEDSSMSPFAALAAFKYLSGTAASAEVLEGCSLPMNWPATITLRRSMADANTSQRTGTGRTQLLAKRTHAASGLEPELQEAGKLGCVWSWWHRLMMDPRSSRHLIYNIINLVFLLYDLTMIPYMLAFDVALDGVLYTLTMMSCIFWTVDIGMTFCTGVYDGQHVDMRPWEVAKRFARTMLVPDLMMASCNWLSLAVANMSDDRSGSSSFRIVRFAQAGKLLRVTGMLRAMRMFRIFEELLDHLLPDIYQVLLKCTYVVLGVAWINHLIGCLWYAIGRSGHSDTGLRWTEMTVQSQADGVVLDFMETGRVFQYITAFHWSVAQFTLGAADANPVNSLERFFNTACLLMGLICGSTLISSLSASMVDYQMSQKSRNDELRKLRHFLRENKVSQSLALLVMQQATQRLRKQDLLPMRDVHALQRISNSLLTDLRCELFTPHLHKHPLFRLWITYDKNVMQGICKAAIECHTLLEKDDLFCAGSSTDRTYCLMSGSLEYVKAPETAPVTCITSCKVATGSWISEASLWSHWNHVGTAWAVSACQILDICVDGILVAMRGAPDLKEVNTEYCVQFHKCIAAAKPPLPWPDDLYVPNTEYESMVLAMTLETQEAISNWALDEAVTSSGGWLEWKSRRSKSGDVTNKLKQEIHGGQSCVMLNDAGHAERLAMLVVLDVQSKDGMMLVNLGSIDECGDITCSCKPPAFKKDQRVTVAQTLQQLLESLGLERYCAEVQREETIVETGLSKRFGIQTKYHRMMHSLTLAEPLLQIPSFTVAVPIASRRVSVGSGRSRKTLMRGRSTIFGHTLEPQKDFMYITVYKGCYAMGQTRYYTWLDPTAVERLTGPSGGLELKEWVQAVRGADEEDVMGL